MTDDDEDIFVLADEPGEGEYVSDSTLHSLIAVYYEDNPAGGSGHLVFDEEAVTDEALKFCIQEAILRSDWICAGLLLELMKRHPNFREAIVRYCAS